MPQRPKSWVYVAGKHIEMWMGKVNENGRQTTGRRRKGTIRAADYLLSQVTRSQR